MPESLADLPFAHESVAAALDDRPIHRRPRHMTDVHLRHRHDVQGVQVALEFVDGHSGPAFILSVRRHDARAISSHER